MRIISIVYKYAPASLDYLKKRAKIAEDIVSVLGSVLKYGEENAAIVGDNFLLGGIFNLILYAVHYRGLNEREKKLFGL